MATILIVDDHPTNREFLTTLLGYNGHRLLEAADGAEALRLAHAERPDLVISDILMPTMDGYEFVRGLRADATVAGTPVIFFTAHYLERETRRLAQKCGITTVLSKPAEPEGVLQAVDAALGAAAVAASQRQTEPEFDREHLRIVTDKLAEKVDELTVVNQRLTALIELSQKLASERDPVRILEGLCRAAREIVGAKYATVVIAGEDGRAPKHFVTAGMTADVAERLRSSPLPPGSLAGLLVKSGALRWPSPGVHSDGLGLPSGYPAPTSLLAASVGSLHRVHGWLCLTDKLGAAEFSEDEENLVRALGGQVGRIYENGSLCVELQQRASELEQEVEERVQVEDALRASEMRFRALIEHSSEAIALVASDGSLSYVSPVGRALFGQPVDADIGQNAFQSVHPDDLPNLAGQFAQLLEQPGNHMTAEFRYRDPLGSWRWIEATGTNWLGDPSLHSVVVNYREITERKRAEEAREHEARVVSAIGKVGQELMMELDSPDLMSSLCKITADVLRCDSSHTLLWQEDEQMFRPIAGFGYTLEEEQSAATLRLPSNQMQGVLSRLDDGDVVEVRPVPGDILALTQPCVSTQLCLALRHRGELIGIHVARRRADAGSFTPTDRRIARGVAQLASLALSHVRVRKDLERADRVKSDFVATMSHELRTPLNIIMGYTDLVLDGDFGGLPLEANDALQRVMKSAHELLNLINATLDLGRLDKEQVAIDPQPICLADMVSEILEALGQKPEVDVVCDVPADLSLQTDPVKLKVILRNVIANAFKFTESGTVTVKATAREAGVEISVSDTGVGIAPDVLPIIFEQFRQGEEAMTRRFGGVGLGLYIVRRLLDILAGTITVESGVGRGSTFQVSLPRLP